MPTEGLTLWVAAYYCEDKSWVDAVALGSGSIRCSDGQLAGIFSKLQPNVNLGKSMLIEFSQHLGVSAAETVSECRVCMHERKKNTEAPCLDCSFFYEKEGFQLIKKKEINIAEGIT